MRTEPITIRLTPKEMQELKRYARRHKIQPPSALQTVVGLLLASAP